MPGTMIVLKLLMQIPQQNFVACTWFDPYSLIITQRSDGALPSVDKSFLINNEC